MATVFLRQKRSLSTEGGIILGVSIVGLVCIIVLALQGVNVLRPRSFLANAVLYLFSWFGFELVPYFRAILAARPESPLAFSWAYLRERAPVYRRGLPMIVLAILFMPLFSAMKSSIPLFTDYTWDQTLIEWDRAIFGQDAWRVFQPFLGFPIVTSAISLAYHLWVLLIYAGVVWFAVYCKDEALRLRYFASYFSIWTVVGMAMAMGMASVGPCFLEPLLGIDSFAPQMEYLRNADEQFPIMVLDVQDQLLAGYQAGHHGLGRGITAMPSMHVALSTLFWLAMRHVSSLAGWVFGLFNLVVFIGSVHLAYHYAVDGLAGGAVAFVIWLLFSHLGKSRQSR